MCCEINNLYHKFLDALQHAFSDMRSPASLPSSPSPKAVSLPRATQACDSCDRLDGHDHRARLAERPSSVSATVYLAPLMCAARAELSN